MQAIRTSLCAPPPAPPFLRGGTSRGCTSQDGAGVATTLVVAVIFLSVLVTPAVNPLNAAEPNQPKVAAASNEGELAISRIKTPDGLMLSLWAAEPMLANPVAFCIDERGRIYVAETYRQGKGVEDDRGHMDWLDDDLAAETVEDRLAYFWKRLGDKVWNYTKEQDRVVLLEDRVVGQFELFPRLSSSPTISSIDHR